MKPVTDEELKKALEEESWASKIESPCSKETRRHDQIIQLALKRWILDRRDAKRKKEAAP